MDMCDYDVIIVGGGIAGLATAAALVRRGMEKSRIAVFEKALALEPIGAAIGLFPNGFEALEEISSEVASKVRESAIHLKTSRIFDLDGTTLLRETEFAKVDTVSPTFLVWYLLQKFLREDFEDEATVTNRVGTTAAANQEPSGAVKILKLGHIVTSFSVDNETHFVSVNLEKRLDGQTTTKTMNCNTKPGDDPKSAARITKTCRVLVGADGIHSTIRSKLFDSMIEKKDSLIKEPNFHNKVMFRGVLPLHDLDDGTCPPEGISLAFQGDEKGKLFAFRETAKGIVTFTAMAVFTQEDANDLTACKHTKKKDRLRTIFSEFPPSVHHVIDRTSASAIFFNAVYDIDTIEEWSNGPIILIGDAAHAMTPGMGQGANQGLEDACELAYAVSKFFEEKKTENETESIAELLQAFWHQRIERVNAIHALSRGQTEQVNQSDKNSRLLEKTISTQFSRDELYQWKPSFKK